MTEEGHEAVVRLLLEKADGRVSPAAFTYNSVPLNPLTEAIRLLTLLPGSVPRTDIMQIVESNGPSSYWRIVSRP